MIRVRVLIPTATSRAPTRSGGYTVRRYMKIQRGIARCKGIKGDIGRYTARYSEA